MKPLNQLDSGQKAYIVDMRDPNLCERLFEMGVFPGDLVVVKENLTDRNSLLVTINDKTFNIYKGAAETIITNVVSFEMSLN
jgi:Fe2+ transport system protein FeoA